MNEILAMLTAQTSSMSPTGGGGEVTPEMVAASLKDLPRRKYLYALFKYAYDDTVKKELYQLTRERVLQQAKNEGWKLAKSETEERIVRLGLLALRQALVSHCCTVCNGTGVTEQNITCRVCGGSGVGQKFSQRTLAKILDVSHKRVRSFWMARYIDQEALYLGFDVDIYQHVRRVTGKRT